MTLKLGYCGWLLAGKSLPDVIDFLEKEGFCSVSWLQNIMTADPIERQEAAAAIREKNFLLHYHGNVQGKLTPDCKLDEDFAKRMFDDVIWWHENTNGVISCCSDNISAVLPGEDKSTFLEAETFKLFQMESIAFEPYGIGYGIENSCGPYGSLTLMEKFRNNAGDAPHAGMIMDVGHAYIHATQHYPGMSLAEYLQAIPFRFCEMHITDNHGTRDEHLIPGEGTLDFSQLRAAADALDYQGVYSLEVCKDICNGLYSWDLNDPADADCIKLARDRFIKAMGA